MNLHNNLREIKNKLSDLYSKLTFNTDNYLSKYYNIYYKNLNPNFTGHYNNDTAILSKIIFLPPLIGVKDIPYRKYIFNKLGPKYSSFKEEYNNLYADVDIFVSEFDDGEYYNTLYQVTKLALDYIIDNVGESDNYERPTYNTLNIIEQLGNKFVKNSDYMIIIESYRIVCSNITLRPLNPNSNRPVNNLITIRDATQDYINKMTLSQYQSNKENISKIYLKYRPIRPSHWILLLLSLTFLIISIGILAYVLLYRFSYEKVYIISGFYVAFVLSMLLSLIIFYFIDTMLPLYVLFIFSVLSIILSVVLIFVRN